MEVKIQAWAVVQTDQEDGIPIFKAGTLQKNEYVEPWAIFKSQEDALYALESARSRRGFEGNENSKVLPIEITYKK